MYLEILPSRIMSIMNLHHFEIQVLEFQKFKLSDQTLHHLESYILPLGAKVNQNLSNKNT